MLLADDDEKDDEEDDDEDDEEEEEEEEDDDDEDMQGNVNPRGAMGVDNLTSPLHHFLIPHPPLIYYNDHPRT